MSFLLSLCRVNQTIDELHNSIVLSQNLERKIFQNEVQLLIDKHQVSLELDKEKLENSKLRKIANITGPVRNNHRNCCNSDKQLNQKCAELQRLAKRREAALSKAKAEMKRVSKENIKLNSALEHTKNRETKLEGDIKGLTEVIEQQKYSGLSKCNNFKYAEKAAQVEMKLKELNSTIKRLSYHNAVLAEVLENPNSSKKSSSTQVLLSDLATG